MSEPQPQCPDHEGDDDGEAPTADIPVPRGVGRGRIYQVQACSGRVCDQLGAKSWSDSFRPLTVCEGGGWQSRVRKRVFAASSSSAETSSGQPVVLVSSSIR